ncbi:MAG TPA: hypothetical protein VNF74_07030, partial [Terriglobales bacterium]|nr:hypothetical protein [Terriglobales bacterium]
MAHPISPESRRKSLPATRTPAARSSRRGNRRAENIDASRWICYGFSSRLIRLKQRVFMIAKKIFLTKGVGKHRERL